MPDPTAQLLALADELRPGEAMLVPGLEMALARTKGGRVRCGFGWIGWVWPRGDAAELAREHVAARTDRVLLGHLARRYREDLALFLASPSAFEARGIGRMDFGVDQSTRRRIGIGERA